MQKVCVTGIFDTDIDQFHLVMDDSDRNFGCKPATANARCVGIVVKDVEGASGSATIAESVQTSGEQFVKLASGETVVVGDPLKCVGSAEAGKAAVATDNVFGFSRENATGPRLITCVLSHLANYQ